MEIAPNYTIPALLPLPGADSLVQLPRMGDGQYWPLASIGIGTDVEATTTPLPWQQIFRVTTRGGGGWVCWIGGADDGPRPPPSTRGMKRQQSTSNGSIKVKGGRWLARELWRSTTQPRRWATANSGERGQMNDRTEDNRVVELRWRMAWAGRGLGGGWWEWGWGGGGGPVVVKGVRHYLQIKIRITHLWQNWQFLVSRLGGKLDLH
jgi:hypothetical protein